jgi:hypothetical protein
MDTVGGDINEKVDDLFSIYIRLTELDPLIVFPLGGSDLANPVTRETCAAPSLPSDEASR